MALDERRVKFRPLFHTDKPNECSGGAIGACGMRGDSVGDQETNIDEVPLAGVHCGMFWSIRILRPPVHNYPFRRQRRVCQKQQTRWSHAHSASVDDQGILQNRHWHHFRCVDAQARGWARE